MNRLFQRPPSRISSHRFVWSAGVAALAIAGLVAGCGGSDDNSSTSGSAGGTNTGSLRLALTDAPACGYDHVYVTVVGVQVNKSATAAESDPGWVTLNLATPRRIDLLTLTNGALEELGTLPLEAGTYNQIRLLLGSNGGNTPTANAVQPTGGSEVALTTPSAQQSGLKLRANFTVQPGTAADLVLDFDACRSVVRRGNSGNFNLKPVVQVFQRQATLVQGYVDASAGATVSVQQNGAVVRSTAPDNTGKFTIPYLPAGSYDLVLTAPNRATVVIAGVALSGNSSVTLNAIGTPVAMPASTMRDVSGTLTTASAGGSGGAGGGAGGGSGTPLTEGTVRATQGLTGGPVVEIARTSIDATTGAYTLSLPEAAPVRTTYTTGSNPGAWVWVTDTPVAGSYTIEASSPNLTNATSAVTLPTYTGPLDFVFNPS